MHARGVEPTRSISTVCICAGEFIPWDRSCAAVLKLLSFSCCHSLCMPPRCHLSLLLRTHTSYLSYLPGLVPPPLSIWCLPSQECLVIWHGSLGSTFPVRLPQCGRCRARTTHRTSTVEDNGRHRGHSSYQVPHHGIYGAESVPRSNFLRVVKRLMSDNKSCIFVPFASMETVWQVYMIRVPLSETELNYVRAHGCPDCPEDRRKRGTHPRLKEARPGPARYRPLVLTGLPLALISSYTHAKSPRPRDRGKSVPAQPEKVETLRFRCFGYMTSWLE